MQKEIGPFEKRVKQLYRDQTTKEAILSLAPVVENLESRLKRKLALNGQFGIDFDALCLMFVKPQITNQFHLVTARTTDSYIKAVETHDASFVKEWVFFVNNTPQGIQATVAPKIPAAYDLPRPKIKTSKDQWDQTSIMMVHTHPPIDKVLAPSTIIELPEKKYVGDLYAFTKMHDQNQEGSDLSKAPAFIKRPLSLTIQEELESIVIQMLFIRESNALRKLTEDERIRDLKGIKRKMGKARRIKTVQTILNDLGFRSSYLELPSSDFYNYPFLGPQLTIVAQELEIQ